MILCGRDATFQERARFRIEAEAMACLDHPRLCGQKLDGLVNMRALLIPRSGPRRARPAAPSGDCG
jgi:hypothetical protein